MSETEWKVESPENKASQVEIPEILPLLPIRDIVIYPYMMLPLFVGRDVSIRAVEEALSRDRLIFLVSQKNSAEENPSPADIHQVGTIASIMRMLKLADGRVKILVQGLAKGEVDELSARAAFLRSQDPQGHRADVVGSAHRSRSADAHGQGKNRADLESQESAARDRHGDRQHQRSRRAGGSGRLESAAENRGEPGDPRDFRSHRALEKSQRTVDPRARALDHAGAHSEPGEGRDEQDPARLLPARAD